TRRDNRPSLSTRQPLPLSNCHRLGKPFNADLDDAVRRVNVKKVRMRQLRIHRVQEKSKHAGQALQSWGELAVTQVSESLAEQSQEQGIGEFRVQGRDGRGNNAVMCKEMSGGTRLCAAKAMVRDAHEHIFEGALLNDRPLVRVAQTDHHAYPRVPSSACEKAWQATL